MEEKKIAITHGASHHLDELTASLIIQKKYPNIKIKRVLKVTPEMESDPNTIIYDIGWGRFDHHQPDGEVRPNGIKYAACGLIWREFGLEIMNGDHDAFEMFDKQICQAVDVWDNGQVEINDGPLLASQMAVGAFNKLWDEDFSDPDAGFWAAMAFLKPWFDRALMQIKSKCHAKSVVDAAVKQYVEGDSCAVVFDQFIPWQDWLLSNKDADSALYAVFPSDRGGWCIQTIPVELGSFNARKSLPVEWAGKTAAELQQLTGLPDVTFCHNGRFLAAANSKESALKLAELARNA